MKGKTQKKKSATKSIGTWVIVGVTVVALISLVSITRQDDQKQHAAYQQAASAAEPSFASVGDCQAMGNCPPTEPVQAGDQQTGGQQPAAGGDDQPADTTDTNADPAGGSQTAPSGQGDIKEQIASLIKQLKELLSGGCPTSETDANASTPTTGYTANNASGTLTANYSRGRGHGGGQGGYKRGHWRGRHHGRGHHRGKGCPKDGGGQPAQPAQGDTPADPNAAPVVPSADPAAQDTAPADPAAAPAAPAAPDPAQGAAGAGQYGSTCTTGTDCQSGLCHGLLNTQTNTTTNFCSQTCTAAADCPNGGMCNMTDQGQMVCIPAQ
jgi:hypothetical protein